MKVQRYLKFSLKMIILLLNFLSANFTFSVLIMFPFFAKKQEKTDCGFVRFDKNKKADQALRTGLIGFCLWGTKKMDLRFRQMDSNPRGS